MGGQAEGGGRDAAYREAIGTAEDARALKEIYPGGVAEREAAAERERGSWMRLMRRFIAGMRRRARQLAQRMMRAGSGGVSGDGGGGGAAAQDSGEWGVGVAKWPSEEKSSSFAGTQDADVDERSGTRTLKRHRQECLCHMR